MHIPEVQAAIYDIDIRHAVIVCDAYRKIGRNESIAVNLNEIPGTGMKPEFFYSATRSRRPRLVALEDADEMFVQLDNGNLSDVGDTEDEEDEDFIFEEASSDDCALQA
ncbi:hypothetical protein HPB50_025892 [Hyalomma asiaticum]|uniref:Uncharacterized protein n=1 Tax=Hyalomma asiaticum TaxID=266040 RepID=A0ACB7TQT7_HYAAI|nr:hypothetical protein HPB50_025892 [Hyalomma asiaticum]